MGQDNYRSVRLILWIILLVNIAVALTKLGMGYAMGSAGVVADGFHSLADGTSNVIALVGIWLAARPVDAEHPYGHRKFEMLAGLVIAGMLFIMAGKVVIGAVVRFIAPVSPSISALNLAVLAVTLLINIAVAWCEYRRGHRLKSELLIADSMHTRSDIYITIGILLTLVGIRLGLPSWVDPLASLVVAGFIFYAGYRVFIDMAGVLLDQAAVDSRRIEEIATTFPEVENVHKVRSRGGFNEIFVDMHIMTAAEMSVQESHDLIHRIEAKICQEIGANAQVIIHIEPYLEK
jgi:cation diffusion facilitator family transporter